MATIIEIIIVLGGSREITMALGLPLALKPMRNQAQNPLIINQHWPYTAMGALMAGWHW
jgi:hypothetical protein